MENEKEKFPRGKLPLGRTAYISGKRKKQDTPTRNTVRVKKNDKGEPISGIRQLIRPEFGTGKFDKYGQPEVNWSCLSEYADEDGFDRRYADSSGKAYVEVTLPYGTRIIRYGSETGHFTAPKGTPYEKLAMPYVREKEEYNEYKVIADNVRVVCVVKKGIAAPGFDSDGGAVQYRHQITIQQAIRKGLLERISL